LLGVATNAMSSPMKQWSQPRHPEPIRQRLRDICHCRVSRCAPCSPLLGILPEKVVCHDGVGLTNVQSRRPPIPSTACPGSGSACPAIRVVSGHGTMRRTRDYETPVRRAGAPGHAAGAKVIRPPSAKADEPTPRPGMSTSWSAPAAVYGCPTQWVTVSQTAPTRRLLHYETLMRLRRTPTAPPSPRSPGRLPPKPTKPAPAANMSTSWPAPAAVYACPTRCVIVSQTGPTRRRPHYETLMRCCRLSITPQPNHGKSGPGESALATQGAPRIHNQRYAPPRAASPLRRHSRPGRPATPRPGTGDAKPRPAVEARLRRTSDYAPPP
jgi:hypothetical protein